MSRSKGNGGGGGLFTRVHLENWRNFLRVDVRLNRFRGARHLNG